MKIVFMGTPEFALKSLARLYADGHEITGVFTQADKPRNRGMKLSYSPVKEFALEKNLPIFQPEGKLSADIFSGIEFDLITVVAYGKLLPVNVLALPRFGCVNIHASLLPKFRGAAPIQHAVLSGEKETGVTSMYMAEKMDAGDIIFTEKTPIGEHETSGDLFSRLSILGAELLSKTVREIEAGRANRTPQNHAEATYAPMLKKEMSPIDWSCSSKQISCKIRGLNPWPMATMELSGKSVKILTAEISDTKTELPPGQIITDNRTKLEVVTGDGTVCIKLLQAPGGKAMSAADYMRGNRVV
ncbi:MAG: methionyl-tRNA formyltransferase [Oscillospiraceae bacterium]|nr:methionyl-tRNA formyltransferase [Oscillospiraceae bacterium]MCL2278320.1 methionyl-tRNA formyltransferase [Oscillospiraceae bacterium]